MNRKFKRILALFIIFLMFISCSYKRYFYQKPKAKFDGLETGTLTDVNIDTTKINALITKIISNEFKNIHSLLIIKDNKLVCEEYFNGYTAEKTHNLFSAGKSIVSVMTGIAIDKGFIKDSNQTLKNLFPEHPSIINTDSPNSEIKIKDILTMRTGLDCGSADDYENSCAGRLLDEKDPIQYIMQLPLINTPGQIFSYNDGTPKMMQHIIQHFTKLTYDQFIYKFLYVPLDINTYRPVHGLTPREMVKIGMLYLNNGKWRGIQVVSKEWIDESTSKHVERKYGHYGYYWWIGKFIYPDKEIETYYAAGNGGQYIFVFNELNMVVVFTGGNVNDNEYSSQPLYMLDEYIIPAVLQLDLQ